MDSFDPHDGVRSSLTSTLHFSVLPAVSVLWKRAESPLLQLLTVVRQYERPAEKHLPDQRWSLPSSLGALRYWQRGVQSMLEQRGHFGWDWKRQVRELRDLLKYLPSRAELIAHRVMGMEASVASQVPPVPMELPEPADTEMVGGLSSPPTRRVGANLESGSGGVHRLKVRAFDAPLTRMDNIRRARVFDRLMESGRSLL